MILFGIFVDAVLFVFCIYDNTETSKTWSYIGNVLSGQDALPAQGP